MFRTMNPPHPTEDWNTLEDLLEQLVFSPTEIESIKALTKGQQVVFPCEDATTLTVEYTG